MLIIIKVFINIVETLTTLVYGGIILKEYTVEKALKLPHLSSFDKSTVITELGLYEDVVIDTYDVRRKENEVDDVYGVENYISGRDANVLFAIRENNSPFMLPCVECEQKQAFKDSVKRMSLRKYVKNHKEEYLSVSLTDEYNNASVFAMGDEQLKENYNKSQQRCMEDILAEPYIHREYQCVLNPEHKVSVSFVVEKIRIKQEIPVAVKEYLTELNQWNGMSEMEPVMSDEVRQYYESVKKVEGYVIIRKIGQYPSMADMQYFESGKYRRVLKKQYRDYSLALGLLASGVGCGSFIYLRRVFEFLVERLHEECIGMERWDEEKYKKYDFNDKIRMLERFGKVIIPNELEQVRNKIYGVLSKGVHQSSDQECMEIFPYVKYALEMIMDEQIVQLEKKEKLRELQKRLNSF